LEKIVSAPGISPGRRQEANMAAPESIETGGIKNRTRSPRAVKRPWMDGVGGASYSFGLLTASFAPRAASPSIGARLFLDPRNLCGNATINAWNFSK